MNVVIGSDHAGYDIKEELKIEFTRWGHQVIDIGCSSKESSDYPDYAQEVCRAVLAGRAERGVLLCSTGIGMSIAANRFPGIRAALCLHCDMAYAARAHNDANILVLGAKYTPFLNARAVAQVFMGTHFSNEQRHLRRIQKLETHI